MKFLGFVILFCIPIELIGQVDYMEFKDHYTLTCGIQEYPDVLRNVAFVDSIAEIGVLEGEGEHLFLHDYGMAYHSLYLKTNKRSDLIVAIESHKRSWEKYQDVYHLFQVGSMYAGFDCTMSRKYLDEFKKHYLEVDKVHREYYDNQLDIIFNHLCPNE